jgi:inositol phosphorylceramide synthase catalytic subunit
MALTAKKFALEWTHWWKKETWFRRLWPAGLVAIYWGILFAVGGLKPDNVQASGLALILYYLGPRFRNVLVFLLPLLLTGVVYDSQRYYADLIRGPIHVKEPYLFDKRFFGISTEQGVLTPNEWLQLHTLPVFDFFSGLAYLIFVPVFVLCAAYFRFWLSRTGSPRYTSWGISALSPQVMWAFFWLNVLGFSTYYWYAASPPWYVALYGLGPAKLVPPNQAGCVRFDALFGTHFFTEWYGRSADVHGAIPSLHIAYPLVAVYYAFKFGGLRIFTVLFYALMCFSAVYLNHHYVLDVLWGSVYALTVCLGMDAYYSRRLKKLATVAWRPSLQGSERETKAESTATRARVRLGRKHP